MEDLKKLNEQILSDKDFAIKIQRKVMCMWMLIHSFVELVSANKQYNEKLKSCKWISKLLFTAAWKLEEFKQLVDCLQKAVTTINNISKVLTNPTYDRFD